ncbi:MAG: RNA-binding domain-containing protein [Candidatus Magasanikbacteria bacterium]
MSKKEVKKLLKNQEGRNLEFKEAKNQFDESRDLPDYCSALANEGGGKLILGVANDGSVVGTNAFKNTYQKLPDNLLEKLGVRVKVDEYKISDKRVLVFDVSSRRKGEVIESTGNYKHPMRAGESLKEMDQQTLKRILNETEPDFSAKTIKKLDLKDIDDEAVEILKEKWSRKSGREVYLSLSKKEVLKKLGLLKEGKITYAALVILGKQESIEHYLPGAEIIFEWRQDKNQTAHDFRKTWKQPFMKIFDEIWQTINNRNIRLPLQEGFFQREIHAFNEKTTREAILNAVTHRDYRINDKSILIKSSPGEFFIESPGGLPPGITTDNIIHETKWRNRKIAEVFEKTGLVERSGQGMDDIYKHTIKEGKGIPTIEADDFSVKLIIPAKVVDKNFITFLEKVSQEKELTLSVDEIVELERIREKRQVKDLKFKEKFLDMGIVEKLGRTKGTKYILSHKYYEHKDKTGIHTKLKGISRDRKKELIIQHIEENGSGQMSEFKDIFPNLKQEEISNLLRDLKKEELIKFKGHPKTGRWILLNESN